MALAALTVWGTQILTSASINAEFANIRNNALSLISPLTGSLAFGGFRAIGLSAGSVTDPSVQPTGDTHTGIYFSAADTLDIATGGIRAASFATVASGVNYFEFKPSATANPVTMAAAGSDTDIALKFSSKGAGDIDLFAGLVQAAKFNNVASAVNYFDFSPSATGNPVTVAAAGSDTNIGLTFTTKGTGANVFTDGDFVIGNTTPRGRLHAQDSGSHLVFHSVSLVDDGSTAVETLVGGSHGILIVMSPDSTGKGGIFYVSGGGATATLPVNMGAAAVTDADGNICVFSDGDGTYTLKNRLGATLEFAVAWLGT